MIKKWKEKETCSDKIYLLEYLHKKYDKIINPLMSDHKTLDLIWWITD